MDMTEVEYKDHTNTLAHISSDPSRPVRLVLPTGRTGQHYLPTLPVRPVPRTGQTGLRKTERLHTQPQVYNSTKP